MKDAPLVDTMIERLRVAYIRFALGTMTAEEVLLCRHGLARALGDEADLFFRIFARMMNRNRAADALPAALRMLRTSHVEKVKTGPGTAFAGAAHA
jgi:hypothetical protein